MYNPRQNQGHGICGAKNIYSSNVRIDNWVEETIGQHLVQTRGEAEKVYGTVTAESYCDPSQWPELPPMPAKMPSTLELKTKNKDGMPYDLLFEHNEKMKTDDRFRTVTHLTLMSQPQTLRKEFSKDSLSLQKSRQVLEDLNQSYYKTTESRHASAHLIFDPKGSGPSQALVKTAEIPNFRRRCLISKH
eukprot:gene9528-10533_t